MAGSPFLKLTRATRSQSTALGWLGGEGLDGIVAKRLDLPYQPGQRSMVKFKQRHTIDCVVGGLYRKEGTDTIDSLLLGLYDEAGNSITSAAFPFIARRPTSPVALSRSSAATASRSARRAAGTDGAARSAYPCRSGRSWSPRSAPITSPVRTCGTGRDWFVARRQGPARLHDGADPPTRAQQRLTPVANPNIRILRDRRSCGNVPGWIRKSFRNPPTAPANF